MKSWGWALCMLAALAMAGCGREDAPPAGDARPAQGPSPVDPERAASTHADPETPPSLEDVMERDPRYIVGITYPPGARQYPGLARELDAYAAHARADLDEAVASLGQGRPTAPYDLALEFTMLVETPRVVAVAADGSSYTGGAHGNPLVARFVWLPGQERLLEARELIADSDGWQALSEYVREQLHAALSRRVDEEGLEPEERTQLARSGGQMIDEGSTPDPENFAHFEPVMDAGGRIEALRFVFPPYQVGPYSDGTQAVVVPAEVMVPHVAGAYRELFRGG